MGLGCDSFGLSPPHSFDFHLPGVSSNVLFNPRSHPGKFQDEVNQWLKEPEHPYLDASPSPMPMPIPSGVSVPQNLPVPHSYAGHYNFPQDSSSSPSDFAALHTIPGSASSPSLRFTASESYPTPSSQPPTWAPPQMWADPSTIHSYSGRSSVAKSPLAYTPYPVKRQSFEPLWQGAVESSNQILLSTSAPLPAHSRARTYSCRAVLTSQSDDSNNTVRRKKRLASPDMFTSTKTLNDAMCMCTLSAYLLSI